MVVGDSGVAGRAHVSEADLTIGIIIDGCVAGCARVEEVHGTNDRRGTIVGNGGVAGRAGVEETNVVL